MESFNWLNDNSNLLIFLHFNPCLLNFKIKLKTFTGRNNNVFISKQEKGAKRTTRRSLMKNAVVRTKESVWRQNKDYVEWATC